jgi:hypothetical protein
VRLLAERGSVDRRRLERAALAALHALAYAGCFASTPFEPLDVEVDAAVDAADATDATVDADSDDGAVDADPPPLKEALIPPVTGTCPELVAGTVTFAPAGIPPRAVRRRRTIRTTSSPPSSSTAATPMS